MPRAAPFADAVVGSVHRSGDHTFSKACTDRITLLQGLGVEGDAHCGATVRHRYDMKRDPQRANLRQVHLLPSERLAELEAIGFRVAPGELGENISTRGLDLLALPAATRLHLGPEAIVELTGLRNPCVHIENFRKGLLAQMRERRADGSVVRKAGAMAVVVRGGVVRAGDAIEVRLPDGEARPLQPV